GAGGGGGRAFVGGGAARSRARLSAARGEQGNVEQGFKTAEQIFREYGVPFWLAMTELEHAEWLAGRGRSEDAGPLLTEAGEIFERPANPPRGHPPPAGDPPPAPKPAHTSAQPSYRPPRGVPPHP